MFWKSIFGKKKNPEVLSEEYTDYILINNVKIRRMSLSAAKELGYKTGKNPSKDKEGYEVIYLSMDYKSWWPKSTFDQSSFQIVMNKTLADTCSMMVSSDYKERFKAEYIQLKNRYEGLKGMVEKWDNGTLSFTPTCPREIYDVQLEAMKKYLEVLKNRAEMEDVDLW